MPQIGSSGRQFGGCNVTFDGPGQNEDFGMEQVTSNPTNRYKFRTSPIRNVALQTAFFHNGAFTRTRRRDPFPPQRGRTSTPIQSEGRRRRARSARPHRSDRAGAGTY